MAVSELAAHPHTHTSLTHTSPTHSSSPHSPRQSPRQSPRTVSPHGLPATSRNLPAICPHDLTRATGLPSRFHAEASMISPPEQPLVIRGASRAELALRCLLWQASAKGSYPGAERSRDAACLAADTPPTLPPRTHHPRCLHAPARPRTTHALPTHYPRTRTPHTPHTRHEGKG